MRLKPRWRKTTRSRERGVAAIEFALCLFFLVPLTLAVLDYGYYFYIGLNIVEAQQAGITAAARTAVVDCTMFGQQRRQVGRGRSRTACRDNLPDQCGPQQARLHWSPEPPRPSVSVQPRQQDLWELTLAADFKPLIGRVAPWMKSVTAGKARFTAKRDGRERKVGGPRYWFR